MLDKGNNDIESSKSSTKDNTDHPKSSSIKSHPRIFESVFTRELEVI